MVRKKLQNYTSSVVVGPDDAPPKYPHGAVATATAMGHDGSGPVCFQNFVIFPFELE
jgi:hypothetical protein